MTLFKTKTKNTQTYLEKSQQYKGFHYKELKPEMLEYAHARLTEMLRTVIEILNKNNVRYMICGGTLLGAYTRRGFFPWDEDVDMCIFEDDYEKATNSLIKGLPNDMLLQCKITEPNYYHAWVKVRDKKSEVYPKEDKYSNNGVWIDLYKLTKVKKKEVNYRIYLEHLHYLMRRFKGGGGDRLQQNYSSELVKTI